MYLWRTVCPINDLTVVDKIQVFQLLAVCKTLFVCFMKFTPQKITYASNNIQTGTDWFGKFID